MKPNPTVHILLAAYNGSKFISDQLKSIEMQTYSQWSLTVSDDGSTDDTLFIIREFAERVSQPVRILAGPGMGSTQNFFHLINRIQIYCAEDLFAFCDQDDIWHSDKIAVAVGYFNRIGESGGLNLYCCRTIVVDEAMKYIGTSDSPGRPLSFGNALVQNIAGGNTMIFSSRILGILKCINPSHSVWHDWTVYQVAAGCEGLIYFDPTPRLLYRQHEKNVVGWRGGWVNLMKRLSVNLSGRYAARNSINERAMMDIYPHLTNKSKKILELFMISRRSKSPFYRLSSAKCAGIYRQSRIDQVILILAIILRRV